MDLQTKGGKPVTSENALSPNNFRAYSPQTADHSRTPQRAIRVHSSRHDADPDATGPGSSWLSSRVNSTRRPA